MGTTRKEHDFLGELDIPDHLYYGIQTFRAVENFNITGIPISKEPLSIKALGYIKKGAAMANKDCGVLDPKIADAICYGSDQVISGKFNQEFVSDLIQGGAGTSVNMNANEVIANIGLEYLGHKKGEYNFLHPNNHVNCSQSTNDSYPSAFRIALYLKLGYFIKILVNLEKAFADKGEEFKRVLKMGRTQLQDAVPMTLGQEFHSYATTINEDIKRLKEAQSLLLEINMGATAIGTKVNAPEGYPEKCVSYLAKEVGIPLTLAPDLIEATVDTGAYVQIMGTLKRTAVKISKICNDLRLLSSGPRTGLNEINLPPRQPGSSIMPGKVNPVIPEVVNQLSFQVIGNDHTISLASEAGQLELNVMEPVLVFNLLQSLTILENGMRVFREYAISGITANIERCKELVEN